MKLFKQMDLKLRLKTLSLKWDPFKLGQQQQQRGKENSLPKFQIAAFWSHQKIMVDVHERDFSIQKEAMNGWAVGAARTETFRSFRDLTFWSLFGVKHLATCSRKLGTRIKFEIRVFKKNFPKRVFLLLKMDFKHDEDILGLNFLHNGQICWDELQS